MNVVDALGSAALQTCKLFNQKRISFIMDVDIADKYKKNMIEFYYRRFFQEALQCVGSFVDSRDKNHAKTLLMMQTMNFETVEKRRGYFLTDSVGV